MKARGLGGAGRLRAAALHLGISALVGATIVALMRLVWYPGPFFGAMGGNNLALLIIAVDVVLGPLITLVVFDRSKGRWLLFDLAVIASFQLAALTYGIYVVSQARPVYMIFSVDRFELVARSDIQPGELALVRRPEFREIGWGAPRVAGVLIPKDPDEQFRITLSGAGGLDLSAFPQHYVAYEELAAAAIRRAKPLAPLRQKQPEAALSIDAAIAASGRREADLLWVPLKGKVRDYIVLMDAKTGAVAGFADAYPW